MTRRRKTPPKPRQDIDALILIAGGPGVVERTAQAVEDARAVAHAKRTVERALRDAGIGQRQANAVVAGMLAADLLAEAERVRAIPQPKARRAGRLFIALAALSRWLHLAGIRP